MDGAEFDMDTRLVIGAQVKVVGTGTLWEKRI